MQQSEKPISILESNLSSNKANLSDKNQKGIADFNIDFALGKTLIKNNDDLSGDFLKIDSIF
jgi:hypothetical protein